MAPIRIGQIIYEVSNVVNFEGVKALLRASYKMPFKTKVVKLIF
jgi:ribosomal protein L16/L10AE